MSITRREFLKSAALGAVGAAALGAVGGASADVLESVKDRDYFAKPDPITDIAETVDVEVVVVGAGNGGCVAAISAADEGATVAWINISAMVVTVAGEMAALNSKVAMEKYGVSYTEEERNEIVNDICRYASWQNDQRLVKLWAERSGETMDWYVDMMEAKDTHMFLETDMKQTIYKNVPVTHTVYQGEFKPLGPNMMGSQLANPIWSQYADEMDNITKYWEHEALQLLQDESGRVTGIIAKRLEDGKYIQFNASKGVILSTGGYCGNPEFMDAIGYRSKDNIVNNLNGSYVMGDGIKMCIWAGAMIDANHGGGVAFDRAALDPDHHVGEPYCTGLGDIWWPGSQPFLKVNTLGERFMNEDNTYDFNIYGGITQPGKFWFQIFDDNYWEDVQAFHTTICSRVVAVEGARNSEVLPGVHPAVSREDYDACFTNPALESGKLKRCDTIEELAAELGLPGDKLAAAVARYNELCEKGYDADFGKQQKDMRPILQPPFYGIAVGNWLLCTFNGVRVSPESLQAIREDGSEIQGLYVVGNDMGGFFANSYPQMYGGLCQGKTTCFARLAALHACRGSFDA